MRCEVEEGRSWADGLGRLDWPGLRSVDEEGAEDELEDPAHSVGLSMGVVVEAVKMCCSGVRCGKARYSP